MPRDANGNYTLPLPPVVTSTVIATSWANPTLADIAAALTNSMAYLQMALPTGANAIGYTYGTPYSTNTVGDALDALTDSAQELIGAANQIVVTQSAPQQITLSLSPTLVLPGAPALPGVTNGSNAAAGYIGEYVTTGAMTSGVSMPSTELTTLASLVLQPGDWDVGGSMSFTGNAALILAWAKGGLSSSGTLLGAYEYLTQVYGADTAIGVERAPYPILVPVPMRRFSIPTAFTAYITAQANYSAGVLTAGGAIWARRVR